MVILYKRYIYILLLITSVVLSACKKKSAVAESEADNSSPVATRSTSNDTAHNVIVVLGSSTAAGTGASTSDSAWVSRLQRQLQADQKNAQVINLALGGYTTYQIMPTGFQTPNYRPQPDVNKNITKALTYSPTLVIINLPSNDVANNYSDEEILANYQIVANILKAGNIDYIITGSQPRNFSDVNQRARLKVLNDKLSAIYPNSIDDYLGKLSTATWSILDMYSAGDGIHVNDRGHYVVFQSILKHAVFKKRLNY